MSATRGRAVGERRLSYWEAGSVLFAELHHGASTICFVARVTGPLNLGLLRDALELLHARHPLLRARVRRDDKELWFQTGARFEDVPVRALPREDPQHWQRVLEAELKQEFPIDAHLWRITLLAGDDEHEIAFSFHHAISDGACLPVFVMQLLAHCRALRDGERPGVESLPLLPPCEALLRRQPSWEEFLANQAALQLPPGRRFAAYAPTGSRATRGVHRTLGAPELARLGERALENDVSVNAAVNAALLLAAQEREGGPIDAVLSTPINLRPYCDPIPGPEHFGCYISMVNTLHPGVGGGAPFFDLARDYAAQLVRRLPEQGFLPREFDIDVVMSFFDTSIAEAERRFSFGFGATNVGVLQIAPRFGPFGLEWLHGCASRESGDWVILLVLGSLHGRLHCTFSYTEPLLPEAWACAYADAFFTQLARAAV